MARTYSENKITEIISRLAHAEAKTAQQAERRLIKIGLPALEPLLAEVENPLPSVRFRVAYILGRLSDPRAFPALTRLAADPDPAVRYDAVAAMGPSQDRRAIPFLARLLGDTQTPVEIVDAAARSLSKFGVAAIPAVGALLHHRDAEVRAVAAHTLGLIGDPSVLPALVGQFAAEDEDPAIAILEAVAEISGPEGHELLRSALSHPNEAIRENARLLWESHGDAES